MSYPSRMTFGGPVVAGLVLSFCAGSFPAIAAEPSSAAAASLIAKHTTLVNALEKSPFGQPLLLTSSDVDGRISGEIHAVVEHPFAQVNEALGGPTHWCEVMILHLNTKLCKTVTTKAGTRLTLNVGRKDEQDIADSYRADFAYKVTASAADYFAVRMDADSGPLNTSNYRIELEAVALDAHRTFMHLSYAYSYGLTTRLAMQAYLATTGRNKVGFTNEGTQPDGKPKYIGGTRGVIERNTMRYYLAVDAYLGALPLPASQQLERRLAAWFDGTERYPAQLHEVDREAYLSSKRKQAAASGIR